MVEILNKEINSFYDLPFIGPWPLKIGKISRLWATPCSPSPEIWVEAFWHDIPWLVWAIIKPEASDLVSERFGTGHHRKRRKKFHIVDKYPPKFPVAKGSLGAAVFPVVQAAERVGFYLLIVDATLDFAINWMSTAYTWEGCGIEDAAYATGKAIDTVTILNTFNGDPLSIWEDVTAHHFVPLDGYMFVPPNYDPTVGVTMTYTTRPPGDPLRANLSFELIDYETGWILDSATPTPDDNDVFKLSMRARDWSATKPPHSFGVRCHVPNLCHANFFGSAISVYGHKQKGLKWDP